MPRLLCAPDKFKGTASAPALASAIAGAAVESGWTADLLPMSDGGEGLIDVAGGPNRTTLVTGPLGVPVEAAWRLDEVPSGKACATTAVIEMSEAAGLVIAGGREHNDAVAATTRGVGELIAVAVGKGAKRIIVGCGGSATTDGGSGALAGLCGTESFDATKLPAAVETMRGVDLQVACDVRTGFIEAAGRFAPQKGASPGQVELLERRLGVLAGCYADKLGIDVRLLEGAGAAGGLAGGLAALGGTLVSGFALVADLVDFDVHLRAADAVVTGEGMLDDQSFLGKVVGEVASRSGNRPTLCVAGRVSPAGARAAAARGLFVVSLSERFGDHDSLAHPLELTTQVVARWLASLDPK